jgi:hypothetical protein
MGQLIRLCRQPHVESTTGASERRKSGKNCGFVHVGGIDLGPLKSGMRIQVTGMLRDWGGEANGRGCLGLF